jgi:GNAT superfamily N-acetyltransferase
VEVEIRALRREDRAAWAELWRLYLEFYETSVASEVTETTWRRIHDAREPVHGLAAVVSDRLVGIVHYVFHRSTWTAGDYCYLQDLFTAQDLRGRGIGRALIEAVYERARAAGASRVYWLTHETNAQARALYDTVAERSGFIQYRKVL